MVDWALEKKILSEEKYEKVKARLKNYRFISMLETERSHELCKPPRDKESLYIKKLIYLATKSQLSFVKTASVS